MKRAASIALLLLAVFACSKERPTVAQTSSASQPKWMREQKPIEVSPALKKLAEQKDPDVEHQLTPAEVKAALEAAQQQGSSPAAPVTASSTTTGDWQKLEAAQKADAEAYQKRLDSTIVYATPNDLSHYHTNACSTLYSLVWLPSGKEVTRVYVGTTLSLRAAKDRGLEPHAGCGAPSYAR